MSDEAHERREVYYSGRVQGVGFRYTVRRLAAGYAVTGFVKNLPDGRVQLVTEGTVGEVVRFVEEIRAAFGHHIRNVEEKVGPSIDHFTTFEIRF
jgi:acylphosphatase